MNKLQFRRALKHFKPYLHNLKVCNRRQRVLRNSSDDQLDCLGRLFWEIASGSIPIEESVINVLKKKKKMKPFQCYFGTETSTHEFLANSKHEKVSKLCEISIVIPELLSCIF